MPSTEQKVKPFESNTKENPAELHEKLASIIERFEETRIAIRENVKMLEAIQDTSATLDSVYPTQSSQSRRATNSMDMASGTGTSFGLRTISSIDSGVMLTMTSCSELGTQSRSRSFDSWNDASSPYTSFAYQIDEDEKGSLDIVDEIERNSQDGSSSSESDDDEMVDEDVFTDSSSDEEVDLGERNSKASDSEDESHHDPMAIQAQVHLHSSSNDTNQEDDDRFEVQEQMISFEDEVYHELAPQQSPSQLCHIIKSNNKTSLLLSPDHLSSDSLSVGSLGKEDYANPEGRPQHCLVLPAIERVLKQSRPNSLDIPAQQNQVQDEWVERDHFSLSESGSLTKCSRPDHLPPLEKSGGNFQLLFSPIPEESSSEMTPLSPSKRRSQANSKRSPNSSKLMQKKSSGSSHVSSAKNPTTNDKHLAEKERSRGSQHISREGAQKMKQFRKKKKRKHSRPNKKTSMGDQKSSSSSSTSPSQASDCSECSYKHAIKNDIVPQGVSIDCLTAGCSGNVSSSSSSASYCDVIYTTTSSSSDEMSEPSVSHYVNRHLKNKKGEKLEDTQILSLFRRNSTPQKTQPPVMKKMNKEAPRVPLATITEQESQKQRLFAKNIQSQSKKRFLKSKSDEASHSLLRYFRFPSPPRNSEERGEVKDRKSDGNKENEHSHEKITTEKASKSSTKNDARSNNKQSPSSCSCCTSTTDTSSDLAYPGLKPKAACSNSKSSLKSPSRPLPHPTRLQPHHFSTPISEGIPREEALRPATLTQQENKLTNHNSIKPAFKGYTLYVSETNKKAKRRRCSLFERLFGRKKAEPAAEPENTKSNDSRLMLDITGGEVRVKPPLSPNKGGYSYVLVPQSSIQRRKHTDIEKHHDMSTRHDISSQIPMQSQHTQMYRHYSEPIYMIYNDNKPTQYYQPYQPTYQPMFRYPRYPVPRSIPPSHVDNRQLHQYYPVATHKAADYYHGMYVVPRPADRPTPKYYYNGLRNSTIQSKVSSQRDFSSNVRVSSKYPLTHRKLVQLL